MLKINVKDCVDYHPKTRMYRNEYSKLISRLLYLLKCVNRITINWNACRCAFKCDESNENGQATQYDPSLGKSLLLTSPYECYKSWLLGKPTDHHGRTTKHAADSDRVLTFAIFASSFEDLFWGCIFLNPNVLVFRVVSLRPAFPGFSCTRSNSALGACMQASLVLTRR